MVAKGPYPCGPGEDKPSEVRQLDVSACLVEVREAAHVYTTTAFEVVEKPSGKRVSELPLVHDFFWRNRVVRNQNAFLPSKEQSGETDLMAKPAEHSYRALSGDGVAGTEKALQAGRGRL